VDDRINSSSLHSSSTLGELLDLRLASSDVRPSPPHTLDSTAGGATVQ